jgi:hypothetical protein
VIHNWVEKFSQGHSKVADDAQSGHSIEIATDAIVQWAEELIRVDRRIMTVATTLVFSHGLACNIMHDHLKFWKV